MSPERSQYKHIIVDEYQDLNKAEQRLVRLLSEYELPENRTLTVAGDDDQSIFVTLKYAHPEGITDFKDEYPDTFEKTLTICQRCPRRVIDLANAFIISTNRKLHPKLLHPKENASDGEATILQWRMPNHEARGISRIIAHRISTGEVKPEEILVLTPRKQIGYEIVKELESRGINAQTCYTDALLEYKKKAQEGYAYLNLLFNKEDAVSIRVLLGIDSSTKMCSPYERIRNHCLHTGDNIIRTLEKLQSGQLNIPFTEKIVKRYSNISEKLQKLAALELPKIIDELFPENVEEVEEIRQLALSALEQATSIKELYEAINSELIQPALPTSNNSVLVLTLYKAKGLTAKMVIIVNCLEGCIPFVGEYESKEEEQKNLAEQERLFFVALTRTSNILIISSTAIMRRGDVAKMKVSAGTSWYWSETAPSHFIDMLGENAPHPQIGEYYIRNMEPF